MAETIEPLVSPDPATTPWVPLGTITSPALSTYRGDWSSAVAYNAGDIVVYNGILYGAVKGPQTNQAPALFPPPGAQDAIPKSLIDVAGDLIVGTANDTAGRLAKGANGTALRIDANGNVVWAGAELDYAQITANAAAVSATTEATSVAVITGNPVAFDGSKVKIEFGFPKVSRAAACDVTGVFYRDSTPIGQVVLATNASGQVTNYVSTLDTPPAGAHTYSMRIFVSTSNSTLNAGTGAAGQLTPAYLRVVRA